MNFGKKCSKALRLTTICNFLYQLRLRNHSDYEWWSSRIYKWMEDLAALTGEDLDRAKKFSILLINLGENFSQIRQGLATNSDASFKTAMETIRSECVAAEIAQRNSHDGRRRGSPPQNQPTLTQRSQHQQPRTMNSAAASQWNSASNGTPREECFECGSLDHLAFRCPVRLSRPLQFCIHCNRRVHHSSGEHGARNFRSAKSRVSVRKRHVPGRSFDYRNQQEPLNQRRGLIIIGSESTDNDNNLFYSVVSADTKQSVVKNGASASTNIFYVLQTIHHKTQKQG